MRLLLPWLLVVTLVGCTRTNPAFGASDTDRGESGTSEPSGTASTAGMSGGSTQGGTTSASTTLAETGGTEGSEGSLTAVDTLEPPRECCHKHAEPGCDQSDIEECVCTDIPACCESDWLEVCVEKAGLCGAGCATSSTSGTEGMSDSATSSGTSTSSEGSSSDATTMGVSRCCNVSLQAGCNDDAGVQACVCEVDPACCKEAWGEGCIAVAMESCALQC